MKTENTVLMRMARESLEGKWGLAVATFLIYLLIAFIPQGIPGFGWVVGLLIGGPLALGAAIFSLSLSRNQEARLEQLFDGFKNFTIALSAYLLMCVLILLWLMLLIIPGIIAAFSYSMTFYILADEPGIGAMEAIDKSKKLMDGYKWKYFGLCMRFLGWALLCILTLGIGFLWLMPYMQVTVAKFYDDLKAGVVQTENL